MKNFLVYTTLTKWNEPPRSRHQITNVLKKEGVVYFVERSQVGLPKIVVTKVEEGVYTITPYHPVDYRIRYRTPVLNGWYHGWLMPQLQKLGVPFEIVFTFDHTSHQIHTYFNNVVYYCGDDFIGNAKFSAFWINAFHRRIEAKLARGARVVIVTSQYLFERHIKNNPHTHIVGLGAPTVSRDVVFNKPADGLPTLGIVAFLNRRMPLALFDELLKTFKIIFIGPATAEIQKRFGSNANANFAGIKKGAALYQQLEAVDVCIAPYAEDKINKGVTPNKLWLYLALGKPAVVTNIPNIRTWHFDEGVVYKCSNAHFADTCVQAFQENSLERSLQRKRVAAANSWDTKVAEILALYYNPNLPANGI